MSDTHAIQDVVSPKLAAVATLASTNARILGDAAVALTKRGIAFQGAAIKAASETAVALMGARSLHQVIALHGKASEDAVAMLTEEATAVAGELRQVAGALLPKAA